MSITVSCHKCGSALSVSEDQLGRDVTCPACGRVTRASRPSKSSSSSEDAVKHRCPSCGQKLVLTRQVAGKQARCKGCRTRLNISADLSELTVAEPAESFSFTQPTQESNDAQPPQPSSIDGAEGSQPDSYGKPADDQGPVLIPVSSEPALTPATGQTTSAEAAEPESSTVKVPGQRGGYRDVTFFAGLPLGVIAIVACVVSAVMPWMSIPERPGTSIARGVSTILAGSESATQMLGQAPERPLGFLLIPAGVLVFGLIGLVLPRDGLRGGVLLGTTLAGFVAWVLTVAWIQQYLQLWTPIARYVQTPEAFTNWRPDVPAVGWGTWIMAGSLGGFAVITLLNWFRYPTRLSTALGLMITVGIAGGLYLTLDLGGNEIDIGIGVDVSEPEVRSLGGPTAATSESRAVVTVSNRSSSPLVVVPAHRPNPMRGRNALSWGLSGRTSPSGTASGDSSRTSPGAWISDWGRPDLIVLCQRKDKSGDAGNVPRLQMFFGKDRQLGCVLEPDDSAEVEIHFSPVWEAGHHQTPSLAGEWQAVICNVEQNSIASVDFEVPGAKHPQDRNISKVLKQFEQSLAHIEKTVSSLRNTASPLSVHSAAQQLQQCDELFTECETNIQKLGQYDVSLPDDLHTRWQHVEAEVKPTITPAATILAEIEQGQVQRAAAHFRELTKTSAATEFGPIITDKLSGMVLRHSKQLASSGNYQNAVLLLTAVDDASVTDPSLRSELASILAEALIASMQESKAALVTPNGAYGTKATGREEHPPSAGLFQSRASQASAGDAGRHDGQLPAADVLRTAVERVTAWGEGSVKSTEFQFSRMIVQQLNGTLDPSTVKAYLDAGHAPRAAEARCWLGMYNLSRDKPDEAADQFTKAASADASGNYGPLSQLGAAFADLATSDEDELLARIAAERSVFELQAARADWAQEILDCAPEMLCENAEDAQWINHVSIINTPKELDAWTESLRGTIPWVKPLDETSRETLATDVRKVAADGAIVFMDGLMFKELAHIDAPKPPSHLLQGEARPVTSWPNRRHRYPFLEDVHSIPYDVTESQTLIPAKRVLAGDEQMDALLAVDREWLVSAVRVYTVNMGTIISLPDHFGASDDACRFLRELVRYSLKALSSREAGTSESSSRRGRR